MPYSKQELAAYWHRFFKKYAGADSHDNEIKRNASA